MHFLKKRQHSLRQMVDLCGEILERQMLHIMAVDVVEQKCGAAQHHALPPCLGFTENDAWR